MNVKNEDLIKGKKYLTREMSHKDWVERKFLPMSSDSEGYGLFESERGLSAENYRFIAEIKPDEPWTFETCPLPPFTVKDINTEWYKIITAIRENSVIVQDSSCKYKDLFDEYLYIPDRTDRAKELICGVSHD